MIVLCKELNCANLKNVLIVFESGKELKLFYFCVNISCDNVKIVSNFPLISIKKIIVSEQKMGYLEKGIFKHYFQP